MRNKQNNVRGTDEKSFKGIFETSFIDFDIDFGHQLYIDAVTS